MQGDEFRHIVLAMLVTAIFFLLFVFDAIIRENAFGLLASMVMAACVAGRVVYYVVRTELPCSPAQQAPAYLILFSVCSFASYCTGASTCSELPLTFNSLG